MHKLMAVFAALLLSTTANAQSFCGIDLDQPSYTVTDNTCTLGFIAGEVEVESVEHRVSSIHWEYNTSSLEVFVFASDIVATSLQQEGWHIERTGYNQFEAYKEDALPLSLYVGHPNMWTYSLQVVLVDNSRKISRNQNSTGPFEGVM